ncbi:MAG: phosphatase PAP2 family protein [Bacteroidales bacterium]|nr:phosphatase PAP2 family protein [Bacteroidales bacterium]
MIDTLVHLDEELLLFLNSLNSPFFDHFFYIITHLVTWLPLAAVLLFICYRRMGKASLWYFLFLAMVIVLADQFASGIIKPLVARPRPTHTPGLETMVHVVNNYRGGAFGFVSSHAANGFAVATFLALTTRKPLLSTTAFLWALLSSYSRIYLAVHFPADILCGALSGALIAWGTYATIAKVQPQLCRISRQVERTDEHIFTITFLITLLVAALFHNTFYNLIVG